MKRTLIHAFIRMFPIYTVEALYEMFYRICIRNNTLLQSVLRFIEYLAFMPFFLALRMYHLLIKMIVSVKRYHRSARIGTVIAEEPVPL